MLMSGGQERSGFASHLFSENTRSIYNTYKTPFYLLFHFILDTTVFFLWFFFIKMLLKTISEHFH